LFFGDYFIYIKEYLIATLRHAILPAMSDQEQPDQLSDDEIARRMERSLQRAFTLAPKPHAKDPIPPRSPKAKTRPASKGRVHKGKARN